MADKKISELPSGTTVYDADDFAIVQDGTTKQFNASAVKTYVKDGLSKSDVGLGNVDNTSDANKPVSTATQTALASKQPLDADLTAIAALAGTSGLLKKTAANTWTLDTSGYSTTVGTVTSVSGAGTVNGLTLSGTVTSSGSLTLGGTLDLSSPPAIGGTTPAAGAFTTLSSTGNTTLGDASGDTLTINGTAVSIPNSLNFDSNTLFIDAANNRVGVGTSSPTTALDVRGAQFDSANSGNIRSIDNSTLGANKGGGILFGGNYTGTVTTNWAAISGLKDNATDGDYGGYLSFKTRANGVGLAERLRIDSAGSLLLRQSSNAANTSVSFNTTVQNALTLDSSGNLDVIGKLTSTTQTIESVGNGAFGFNPNTITRITKWLAVSGTTSTCAVTFNAWSSWTNAILRVRCACVTGASGSSGAAESIYYLRHVSSATTVNLATTNVTTSANLVLSIAYGTGSATVTATVTAGVNLLWDVELTNSTINPTITFA